MNSPRPASRQIERDYQQQQQQQPQSNEPPASNLRPPGTSSPRPGPTQYQIPRSPLSSAARPVARSSSSPMPPSNRRAPTPAQQLQQHLLQQQLFSSTSHANNNNNINNDNEIALNNEATSPPSRNSTPQPFAHYKQQIPNLNQPSTNWVQDGNGDEHGQQQQQPNLDSPASPPPGSGASLKRSLLDMQAPAFDYDDFRERYDAAMAEHMARDRELLDQYKKVAITLQAWVSVLGQYDQQVSTERRDSRIIELEQKEAELEALRKHSLGIFNGFNNLLEQLNSNPPPPPRQQQYQLRSPQAQRGGVGMSVGGGGRSKSSLGGGGNGGAASNQGGLHTRKRG